MKSIFIKGKAAGRGTKVDLSTFIDYPVIDYSKGLLEGDKHKDFLFNFIESGHRYDFILSKKSKKRLFVVFSGKANSKKLKLNPPVFQRWKWADKFPGSTLFVSDPSLYLNEKLSLAWYIGTKTHDHHDTLSKVILNVANHLGIENEHIIGYGSSGGGYASLRMSSFIPGMTSVAINPQVVIKEYHEKAVNRFLKTCFNSSYSSFDFENNSKRFDIRKAGINKTTNKIIVAQNIEDEFHYKKHFTPLCEHYGYDSKSSISYSNFKSIIFSHPGGHSKAETEKVFKEIIKSCAEPKM